MVNTYRKPETKIVKIETTTILAGSIGKDDTPVSANESDARGFDFFSFEEEEEAPGKSDDDDDWEDWEEEE